MVQFSLMQGLKENSEIFTSCGLFKVGVIHSLRIGVYVIEGEALINEQGGLIFLFIT